MALYARQVCECDANAVRGVYMREVYNGEVVSLGDDRYPNRLSNNAMCVYRYKAI